MPRQRPFAYFVLIVVAGLCAAAWHWQADLPAWTQVVLSWVEPQPTVRFAVVGDNHGVNPIYQQIISDIKDQPYAFLLNLADTSERGTPEEWQAVKELEASLAYPVYHTVGNHDIKTDPTRKTFVQAFGHDRWYSLDIGHLHLTVLDNADRKVGFPEDELNWLRQDLATHGNDVVVTAYHRPFDLPLAAVLGDDETTRSRATNVELKTLLEQAGVDYIFTGHIHTYLPYTVGQIPAVISGGGGDPAQSILGGASNNYFHYLDVTVRGREITVKPIRVTIQTTVSAE